MRGEILILILLVTVNSCIRQTPKLAESENIQYPKTQGGEKMRLLFIIAQKDFRDEELQIPKEIVQNAGHEVHIASITTQKATGKLGMEITPDLAVKDANLGDFDMVIVIGGPGAPGLANYPEVINLLKEANEKNMFIGAICIAPTILAKAGILNGKNATVWSSPLDKSAIKILEENGAKYIGKPVVVDGKLITANGPAAARDFGIGILRLLGS